MGGYPLSGVLISFLLGGVKTSAYFNHSGAPEPRFPFRSSAAAAAVVVAGDMSDARDNVINVNNKQGRVISACARLASIHCS